MNKSAASFASEDWKKIARKDWKRVKRNLRDKDPEAAGYFLQQSLEKYLKSFLLEKGWELKKIHELDALLDEAVKFKSDLKNFYDLCERVTGYYFADRYPPLGEYELVCDDIEKNLKEAEAFIKSMFPGEQYNG